MFKIAGSAVFFLLLASSTLHASDDVSRTEFLSTHCCHLLNERFATRERFLKTHLCLLLSKLT